MMPGSRAIVAALWLAVFAGCVPRGAGEGPYPAGGDLDRLVARLKTEEGFRSTPYRDSRGHLTVGYGLNLEAGITETEARAVLAIRADSTLAKLDRRLTWFRAAPSNHRVALADMGYELGIDGLLKFDRFLALVAADSIDAAVEDAQGTAWARQVPPRARSVLRLLRGHNHE